LSTTSLYDLIVSVLLENISIINPWLQAVVGAVSFVNGMYKPKSFVLHPSSTRPIDMLPDIVAVLNQSVNEETKLMRFQEWGAATLLYNLQFLSEADMELHYASFLHKTNAHPIYEKNPKQALIFIKKCITAISQTALEIVSPWEKWQTDNTALEDLQSFDILRKESFQKLFMEYIDKECIWSQYQKLSVDIKEFDPLTKTLVYFTAKKWSTIDFDTVA
jgi:hypothetical protein